MHMNHFETKRAPENIPPFEFPQFFHTPELKDFYSIIESYAKHLEDNHIESNHKSWKRATETIFSRYQYLLTNKLDQDKTSFKKFVEQAHAYEKSLVKKNTTRPRNIKDVHAYYAQEREQARLRELELLGRVDEDGYADY